MMHKVYFSLGSNLDDKEKNLENAMILIEKRVGKITSRSAFYSTAPWGFVSENSFVNNCICVNTGLTVQQILLTTKEIEKQIGRLKKSSGGIYSDRLIDIDILLYDDMIISTEDLVVPHPLMHKRQFVMTPLAEIAPQLQHPIIKKSIREISDELAD